MIEILRLSNPWSTGKSVDRIVPLYMLHNLLVPNTVGSPQEKALRLLIKRPDKALNELPGNLDNTTRVDAWKELAEGLMNPDRRIFNSAAGVSDTGSLFPITGDLVKRASDDGLGAQLRLLLDRVEPDWSSNLHPLLFPMDNAVDAPYLLVRNMIDSFGTWNQSSTQTAATESSPHDRRIHKFISNLLVSEHKWCRLNVLREFAMGAFAVATLELIQYTCRQRSGNPYPILCYGGLPPGMQSDPLVQACSDSWDHAIAASFISHVEDLDSLRASEEKLTQRLDHVKLENPKFERLAAELEIVNAADARDLLEKHGLTQRELSRRLRSLGANVGLAGPDRGVANPRFYIDTPLLGIIVHGIVGDGEIELDDFISCIYEVFGLVLGPGANDTLYKDLAELGTFADRDLYSLLLENKERLRLRLVRTGLARTYSDSHTEVTLHA